MLHEGFLAECPARHSLTSGWDGGPIALRSSSDDHPVQLLVGQGDPMCPPCVRMICSSRSPSNGILEAASERKHRAPRPASPERTDRPLRRTGSVGKTSHRVRPGRRPICSAQEVLAGATGAPKGFVPDVPARRPTMANMSSLAEPAVSAVLGRSTTADVAERTRTPDRSHGSRGGVQSKNPDGGTPLAVLPPSFFVRCGWLAHRLGAWAMESTDAGGAQADSMSRRTAGRNAEGVWWCTLPSPCPRS